MQVLDLLRAAALVRPRKPALVAHGVRLTYEALWLETVRLAGELRSRGVRPGERVVVLVANSAETAVAIWAVLAAGAVVAPVHAATKKAPLEQILANLEPQWAIVPAEAARAFAPLVPTASSLAGVTYAGAGAAPEGWHAWQLSTAPPHALDLPPPAAAEPAEPAELAVVVHTSGSTGEAKGVMWSHANVLAGVRAVNAYLGVESTDVVYSALPLSSSYGLCQLFDASAAGATLVLDRSFAFPTRSLELMARERATVVAGVPTMYAWLATASAAAAHDLSAVRIVTSAAAALPVEHQRRLRERLPGAALYVMYGQTECKRITYLEPAELDLKPGSVGRGMPYQEHALVDADGRRVTGAGEGELVVRGPHVMLGYWRDPEGTARKLRAIDGDAAAWLHTGDHFRQDANGYLHFLGRNDDILKIGGNKVSPREIEDVVCAMPGIRECAVVGVPDAAWGEAVAAFVVPSEGAPVDAAAVIRYCTPRLRGFMVPKTVHVVRELPKTDSGKVRKRDLRA